MKFQNYKGHEQLLCQTHKEKLSIFSKISSVISEEDTIASVLTWFPPPFA